MWYSVRLLYESEVNDPENTSPLQEEVIKLIQAVDTDEALRKARTCGKADEIEYANEKGAAVKWRLIEVLEVQDLCEETLYDGVEVYSRLSWKTE